MRRYSHNSPQRWAADSSPRSCPCGSQDVSVGSSRHDDVVDLVGHVGALQVPMVSRAVIPYARDAYRTGMRFAFCNGHCAFRVEAILRMFYRHAVGAVTLAFAGLKEVMAKATPLRSGDVLRALGVPKAAAVV